MHLALALLLGLSLRLALGLALLLCLLLSGLLSLGLGHRRWRGWRGGGADRERRRYGAGFHGWQRSIVVGRQAGLVMVRVKCSAGSGAVSPNTGTVSVVVVWPGAISALPVVAV